MKTAPWPADEVARLMALDDYDVLDTEPESGFDDLTAIAAQVCQTPIALVSLVDAHRQWFKSRHGLDATETPREVAFCAHAILESGPFIVPEARLDPRFDDNPLSIGAPHVQFYAGAPLRTACGRALGTLCVIDHQPRQLSAEQLDSLRRLGRQVMSQLELRKARRTAERGLATNVQVMARFGHELRTRLAGVMGAVELLVDTPLSTQQREIVTLGEHGVQQLLQLAKDVSRFCEPETEVAVRGGKHGP
jgi:GAF domain-containing protein